jgi:hypothetical protein
MNCGQFCMYRQVVAPGVQVSDRVDNQYRAPRKSAGIGLIDPKSAVRWVSDFRDR